MDKIKELREAMARIEKLAERGAVLPDTDAIRRLYGDIAVMAGVAVARYDRSILNSPDEAAVERAARAVFKEQGYPPACYGGNLWQNKTQRARLIAAAALTAALGVAAPDGGRS